MSSFVIRSFGSLCLCLLMGSHAGCLWQRCGLNKSSLPPLVGFRLGMGRTELEKRFPGLKVKDDSYSELFISGSETLPKDQDVSPVDEIGHLEVNLSHFPEFADVSDVELKLDQGSVSEIELTYPSEKRWKSKEDFLTFVAQTLHLPDRRYWRTERRPHYDAQEAAITCNGLTVRAGYHLIIGSAPGGPAPIAKPYIVVADDNVRRELR